MRIVFLKDGSGKSIATIYRPDGVVVELPSFSRKHRVPHDLAHAVAERELGLAGGVFGTVAAGGLFSNARVIGGRPRHDSAQRSERVVRANSRELGLSELLGGALHHAVEYGPIASAGPGERRCWASLHTEPCPYTDEQVADAANELARLGQVWVRLGTGQTLEFDWPERLIRPVPRPEPRRRETGSRLRRAG